MTIKRDDIVKKLREIADRLEVSPCEEQEAGYEAVGRDPKTGMTYVIYFWIEPEHARFTTLQDVLASKRPGQ